MPLCDQCNCKYPDDLATDLCPNCGERLRRCPWCGETLPWTFTGRATPCCARPLKYIRTQGADVPLLTRGEGIEGGPIFLRVEQAVYFGGNSTVYRVSPTKRLGDPFLLDGRAPPPFLCLKESVVDTRAGGGRLSDSVLESLLRLRHPNIVRLYAAWSEGDRFFQLLDWVPGETAAARYLKADRKAPAGALKRVAEEVMDGLAAMSAPEIGLMHGDLTPFNLAFDASDRPIVIDLDGVQAIDCAERPKELTPHYAPLEFYPAAQLPPDVAGRSGLVPGPASDRYMLGATLYTMACGSDATVQAPDTGLPIVVEAPERAGGTAQMRMGAMRPDLARPFTLWVDDLLSLFPEDRFESHEAARKALKSGARAMAKEESRSGGKSGSARRGAWKSLASGRRHPALGPVPRPIGFGRMVLALAAAALVILGVRYPSGILRPWTWPRLALADVALHRGKPEQTMDLLIDAGPKEWDAQILKAQAQEEAGAPENALQRLRTAAATPGAPARISRALQRIGSRVGELELYQGLRLMERGERYPAYLHLKRASKLGISSSKAEWALVGLAQERGDRTGAQAHLVRYLVEKPASIRGRLMAAQVALSDGRWRDAQAQALRAKQLLAGPAAGRVDPVDPGMMERTLARVDSAIRSSVPDDPRRLGSTQGLQEGIERLKSAQTLRPSMGLDLQLARYYERLGDLSRRADRALPYGEACDTLKNATAAFGSNPAAAALLARCRTKLTKNTG